MSPVRSMTGFAVVEGALRDGTRFTLSLKSVNHRFLDLKLRLPAGCDELETEMRRALKQAIERGHAEVTVELFRSTGGGVRINQQALETLVLSLREAAERLAIRTEPDLATLLRLPGMMVHEAREPEVDRRELMAAVLSALPEVTARLNEAREREGAALAAELSAGMGRLRAATDGVSGLRAGVREAHQERLRAKLTELLGESDGREDRLLTEAALLAEKSDVQEETVRLRAHTERFLELLQQGGAVGKPLDFLLQELAREANTTLAKTGSAAGPDGLRMTALGLEMKMEIERAREQVQNLE